MKNNVKYVIVSTRQKFGGAIALHALCKYLSELGYEASIYYIGECNYRHGRKIRFWIKQLVFTVMDVLKAMFVKTNGQDKYYGNPKFNGYIEESVKDCKIHRLPFVDKKTIAVYPDKVYGNFLHAKNVVRWFLYYNRYGDDAYGKDDLFFTYRDIFNDKLKNPNGKILNVAYFDLSLYKRTNWGERKGVCYIVRKGGKRNDLPVTFDGSIIDDLPEKNKVEIMNQCEYCISYDTQTAYSTIAAICGCISVIIPEKGKIWSDYRSTEEERYGIAFGFSEKEISWAVSTMNKAKLRYEKLNSKGRISAEVFAKQSKAYFGFGDDNK